MDAVVDIASRSFANVFFSSSSVVRKSVDIFRYEESESESDDSVHIKQQHIPEKLNPLKKYCSASNI